MKLGLDYDDTYTADPLLWNWFIAKALERGHEVYCTSFRNEEDMEEPKLSLGLLIGSANCYGTGGLGKNHFMLKQGIQIDVWIDDCPDAVCRGYEYYQLN